MSVKLHSNHMRVRGKAHYKLSNVGIEFGVINWEVRGYLSEIHLKNYSSLSEYLDGNEG